MADAEDRPAREALPAPPPGATRRQILLYAAATALVGTAVLRPGAAFAATVENLKHLERSMPEGTPDSRMRAAAIAGQWGGYSNGQIPVGVLTQVPVSTGQPYLRPDAARAWSDLNTKFTAAFGTALAITEAYRDLARQQALWEAYQNGGTLAAEPGTSIHGWALACDFGSGVATAGSPQKNWMDANAPAYGWQPTGNTFSQVEPWHFEYDGSYLPEEPAPPAAPEPKESDMKIISNGGRQWLVGEFTAVELNTAFLNELKAEYGIPGSLGNLRAALRAQYGDPVEIESAGNVDSLIAVAKKNRAGLISDLGS
jgi:hypothetical protein